MSCLRVGCVWTEVQSAPEMQDEGHSVKLQEGTTVMIHVYTGREGTGPVDTRTSSQRGNVVRYASQM